MKIVADESVDFTIIEMLRERKVEVVAIVEERVFRMTKSLKLQ